MKITGLKCTVLGDNLMRYGASNHRYPDQVFLGGSAAFVYRRRHLIGFANSQPDMTITVTGNHQGTEPEAFPALHYLGHPVDEHEAVIQYQVSSVNSASRLHKFVSHFSIL